MLRVLEQRAFPTTKVLALASPRSAGAKLPFRGGELVVEALGPKSFAGVDIALFSAGASVSREMGPIAAQSGAVVIDNSSAWRMEPDVPLVVPEVNMDAAHQRPRRHHREPELRDHPDGRGLGSPSTTPPRIKHIVVSTVPPEHHEHGKEAHAAAQEMLAQTHAMCAGDKPEAKVFPGIIAHNVLCDWKPGEAGLLGGGRPRSSTTRPARSWATPASASLRPPSAFPS